MEHNLSFVLDEKADQMQEGTFIVPSACKQISLEHGLSMKYTFLVFMLLIDSDKNIRFLKQLSYSEPVIKIGETEKETTIGGVPGSCKEGEWTLRIYTFSEYLSHILQGETVSFQVTVSDNDMEITEEIGGPLWVKDTLTYSQYDYEKVYQENKRWYRGDLHTHTRLSDGKELPKRANEKSKMMELDYYIPTEHNVLHTGWPKTEVMIVPGVEITTALGHANVFGIDKMPESLFKILQHKNKEEIMQDLEEILRECHNRTWLFSINHPFLYIWQWLYDDIQIKDIDCLEIINDPTYEADVKASAKEANQKAVFLSDMLWEDGYRICAIGGSDSHNLIEERYGDATEPSIPGDPTTCLYMDKLTPNHLITALKNCNSYVTRHCKLETNLMFGQSYIKEIQSIFYKITFLETKDEPIVYYIKNKTKYVCTPVKNEKSEYTVEGKIDFDDVPYNWIRFGAEDKNGNFIFYGNPITRGSKEPWFKKYGEIKEKLEQRWRLKEYYSTKMEL